MTVTVGDIVSIATGGWWKTAVVPAPISGPADLREIHDFRQQQQASFAWGAALLHVRVAKCARAAADILMQGDLARGAQMPLAWLEDTSRDPASVTYPRVHAVQRQIERDGGQDALTITFLEPLATGTEVKSYVETRRAQHDYPHDVRYDVYGIAAALDSGGIPAKGDYLDGAVAGPGVPVCHEVERDDRTFPGFVIVSSVWIQTRMFV